MVIAMIPVKSLKSAKSRLSSVFSPDERQTLCLAILEDMLHKLVQAGCFTKICLVSQEAMFPAWLKERELPVELLMDKEDVSLNASAQLAADYAMKLDRTMLFIHADLPLIRTTDIAELLAMMDGHDIVLAADCHGLGTTALLTSLPLPIPPQFGPDSLNKHLQQCIAAGLCCQVFRNERLGLDIDLPEDLLELPISPDPHSEPQLCAWLSKVALRHAASSAITQNCRGDVYEFPS